MDSLGWGHNYYGQLGNGTTSGCALPARSGMIMMWWRLRQGNITLFALKANGTVWDWGYNYYGQLGNGTTTDSYVPVQPIGVTSAIAIAAGQNHTMSINRMGQRWHGIHNNGQLGDSTTIDRHTPVLSNFVNAVSIVAGNHTLVLDVYGNLWGAGLNTNVSLETGTTVNTSTPTAV